jgi:hypothetical protein
MSRGPGRIERAISAAFAADPEGTLDVDALCRAAYPDEVFTWPRDFNGERRPPEKRRRSVLRAAHKVAERQGWKWRRGRRDLFQNKEHHQKNFIANAKARGMLVMEPGSQPSPEQRAHLAEIERRTAQRAQVRHQVKQDLLAQYDALKEKLDKLEIECVEIKAGMELMVLESKAMAMG